MLEKQVLFAKLFAYILRLYGDVLRRTVKRKTRSLWRKPSSAAGPEEVRPIVIIGASFAGYHAARTIATSLPPDSPYKVIIIEPNTHFQFTWVLPRFCVVPDHEHKAFIPYGPYLGDAADSVQWIRDRVETIERKCVILTSGEKIPYEFLVIATGSAHGGELPSRVGAERKQDGMKRLQQVQYRIKDAKKVVVIGAGAAGVELAADAKEHYPEKEVVLVHSRHAVMNRFGPELQAAALKALEELGVEVILNDRMAHEDLEQGRVVLTSGRVVECDYLINCTGQKPSSNLFAELSPGSISPSGHIDVKPTMQVNDDSLPNVYACGDVASLHVGNPNSRSATHQATVAGDNVVLAAMGKKPRATYTRHWADGVIKLTLGLSKSITHFGNGQAELLFHAKEKDIALMSEGAWRAMGATPFEDPGLEPLDENGF
ncbi:predicted protein [Uncinocarpus reesii 1704]|uniref:FAD/NAD(P)-binding domain-containing protein n=1 Tax=Uncinocarpus reesii (strain UAMH 1704) TaxID=336963 RepID=C4JZX2_UNCRE|nr:uncharacterized protein UREG_07723 [Uncinocarpus reesii 1704]EEP82858.1 predicted protein [Uncinocarpus reesii 1704]